MKLTPAQKRAAIVLADKSGKIAGITEIDAKLDRFNYFSQRVICQNKKSEDELLGLIACYFPKLIKEDYQASF